MRTKLPLLLGTILLLAACASENGEDLTADAPPTPACGTAGVTYALTVAPLLQKNCISCHNNSFASGGVNLSVYAQVRAIANDGRLMGTINHDAGYKAMPLGAKLPDCDISQLRRWVADGAPDN
ncbi:MAG: hypothetical protein H7Z21_02530 [Hymenobacter sp.]|nr:hypothetical protein [Hymenobacter sp.]